MSQHKETSIADTNSGSISRRQFMAGAGAAALSFTVVKPELVHAAGANSKINLGLIGCGGRGTWIANLFKEHGGYNLAAVADYFQDRVDNCGGKFGVPESNRFTGLSGYKKVIEKVDAVAIISPPYFHPIHAAAAVDAGRHVYVAKPIAVDVPGCHSIGNSGKKASQKRRCFLVDFQTRVDPFYCESLRRVHEGAIGELVFGEAIYHADCPFKGKYDAWRSIPEHPENRLRAWGLDRVLSGDIITEQNIHTLDVMSWIMDTEPVYAVGTCGRSIRPVGTCNDHFVLMFEYPNKVGITFSSKQFSGYGTQPDGIRNRMFGSKGVLETSYGGQTMVRGENMYRGGRSPGIYKDGAVANIAGFHKSVTEGKFDNPTVAPSVRSNLVTILGRTAAYTGEKVMWSRLVNSTEKLEADLKGMKV
ncbi:MAG: Gfo/Idh/MocA family oxidoreductase [Sedimentisphaerales bacterium]|jgi:myo-inositol 2-dehydrogenase/D-chiro-inositol 1-dehydrogenase